MTLVHLSQGFGLSFYQAIGSNCLGFLCTWLSLHTALLMEGCLGPSVLKPCSETLTNMVLSLLLLDE